MSICVKKNLTFNFVEMKDNLDSINNFENKIKNLWLNHRPSRIFFTK